VRALAGLPAATDLGQPLPLPQLDAAALLAAWEAGAVQSAAARAVTLLTAAWPGVSAAGWAEATIGRRDACLLTLREQLFGTTLETVATCPPCGERLDVAFSTADVRVDAAAGRTLDHPRVEAHGYRVEIRVPTAGDLVALDTAPADGARLQLLRRCAQPTNGDGAAVDPSALPEEVLTLVAAALAAADPQADVEVAMRCPACGHAWTTPFDILTYLWDEVDDWAGRLLREVHALACAYGWSEQAILGLSTHRRRCYLDLVGA
jgi:hypothetical protein